MRRNTMPTAVSPLLPLSPGFSLAAPPPGFVDDPYPFYDALRAQESYSFLTGGRVFSDPRYDAPWVGDRALYFRWGRILHHSGVRYRNPYQTRHTFASTLLSCGVPALYLAKQMDHRDTEMVNRHYGRWIEQGCNPDTRIKLTDFFAHVSPKITFIGLKAA